MPVTSSGDETRTKGITLVELVISIALASIILSGGFMSLRSSFDLNAETIEAVGLSGKLRTSLRRVSDELRGSSQLAEDINGNGALDVGEDLNGNGRLEGDWAVSANSITFNRFLPDGTYSLPITYALVGTNLVRSSMTDAGGTMLSGVIAARVPSFTVASTGSAIVVSMTVSMAGKGGSGIVNQSSGITINQRN